MVNLEQIATAVLNGNALDARSLVQDWMNALPHLRDVRQPTSPDAKVLAVAASLMELFAERTGQPVPPWTDKIAPLAEPLFLVGAARNMPRLRALCENESPAPLRKRRIFAPPNYLMFA